MKKPHESRCVEIYLLFQTIKAYQNYFAILAKMMFLSLIIVDSKNKNKSVP